MKTSLPCFPRRGRGWWILLLNNSRAMQSCLLHAQLVLPKNNGLSNWLESFHVNRQVVLTRTQAIKPVVPCRIGERGQK